MGRRIQLGRIHTVSGQRQDRLVVGRIRGSRRLYGSDRRVDVILLGRFRQRHALIRIGSGVGAHIHRPPVGSAFSIGRRNGIHYLHRIREQLFQRGVDLRVAPERHFLQRLLLHIAGEIYGIAHDGQIRPVGLRAVAGGVLHGDLVVQTRYHAMQLSGEAAVVALRGCADDGHLSRADDILRPTDDAGKTAGVIRAGNTADAVTVLRHAVAGAREAAGHFLAVDRHAGSTLVHCAGNGKQGLRIGLALVQAHQTAHVFRTRDRAAYRAATNQVRHVLGQIAAVQLHLGAACQSAHVRLAGDLHIHQLQVADGRALDDVEEACVLPLRRDDGHMGDGVSLPVKHSRKGLIRAADAVKRRIL